MRKLSAFALGAIAAAALAGTAVAASHSTKVMQVPLPDGSVARIEYVGAVAPRVTIAPAPIADAAPFLSGFPSFAGFDSMIAEMNRRTNEMLRQAQELARAPTTPGAASPYIASFGNAPAGQASTTIVSVSDGAATCTRTTEVVSQGVGKPPKITNKVSGQCAGASPSTAPAPTHAT